MKITIEPTHTETGFDSSWDATTSFTNGTWADLIKAFLNGWQIKSDGGGTDISAFTWQSVAGDGDAPTQTLAYVTGNTVADAFSDTTWKPYKAIYQYAYDTEESLTPSGALMVYPGHNNIIFPQISGITIETLKNADVVGDIYDMLQTINDNLDSLDSRVTDLENA